MCELRGLIDEFEARLPGVNVHVGHGGGRGMAEFLDAVVEDIESNWQGKRPVGLSPQEIDRVRVDQGLVCLPAYYAEFLARMGRSAGRFLRGTRVFYPEILGIKDDVFELFDECGVSHLADDVAVVFSMHGGYDVHWLRSATEPDPPVANYVELQDGEPRCWPSFSTFLREQVDQHLAYGAKFLATYGDNPPPWMTK